MLTIAEKILLQAEYDAGKPFVEAAKVVSPERKVAARNLWNQWREQDPTSPR